MQSDETIKVQKSLRYVEIYKNLGNKKKAEGKFVNFGDDWPLIFSNIPDMGKYYNSASPGSWIWDLDPQAMNDYMANHEGEAQGDTVKIYRFYERYIKILIRTEDPYWFQNQKYRYLDREIPEAEAAPEDDRKDKEKVPLPLHHENCPGLNGLIWTWTPKKYVAAGQWVTCSKCKKGFKVQYSEESENKSESGIMQEKNGVRKKPEDKTDLMREGYRGSTPVEVPAKAVDSDTVPLNTKNEDPAGQKQEDPVVTTLEAAEDLAADAVNLFMDVVTDHDKMKALESDPELKAKFKQLMNTTIPAVDLKKVTDKAAGKRKWTKTVPELQEESMKLRHQAAEKRECASCAKKLTGSQVYYCSEDCKTEFYKNHPTSVRWNDLRSQVLKRDQDKCVKCGKPAEEVDHIKEIWEGGPEFDLANLQSLCHDCHVAKTRENRRKRQV